MSLMLRYLLYVLFLTPLFVISQADAPYAMYEQKITAEKKEIKNYFPTAGADFFAVIDSLVSYCKTTQQPALYLRHLSQFLHHLDNSAHFRSGRYTDVLRYGLLIISWREQNKLREYIYQYPTLSLQAYALFSFDTCALTFLQTQADRAPYELLRNADFLTEQNGASRAVETALLQDPEYAKRYFQVGGLVAEVVEKSNHPNVQVVRKLYRDYGTRTRAYILLDPLTRKEITAAQADSMTRLGRDDIAYMTSIFAREKPLAQLSLENELRFVAIENVRKYNLLPPASYNAQLNKISANRLFINMALSYNECTPQTFDALLSALNKIENEWVSASMLANMQPLRLAAFMKFMERNGRLSELLYRIEPAVRNDLLNLLAYDETADLVPQLPIIHIPNAEMSLETSSMLPIESADEIEDTATVADAFVPKLSAHDKLLLGWKKNLFATLQNINSIIDLPEAREFLLYTAAQEPDETLKYVEIFKSKYWCKQVVELAAIHAPVTVCRYFNNAVHPVTVILGYSTNDTIKKLLELHRQLGFHAKPMLLFDELLRNEISVKEAIAIVNSNGRFFTELIKIAARKNYCGSYNLNRELNYQALRFIRSINDKINQPFEHRFAALENMRADELYYIMVFGREEVFNSTFNGLFARFKTKVLAERIMNIYDRPHFRSFVSLCANNGKLTELLQLFSTPQQDLLLQHFVAGLEHSTSPLDEAALVAEMLANTTDAAALHTAQLTVKDEYKRADEANNSEALVLYGLLAGVCKDKAVVEQNWFKTTARKFKAASLHWLRAAQLRDHNTTIERMYFYDDEDGRDSYQNFIATFAHREGWHVEEGYNFVKVQSTAGNNIVLYANKPQLEESGDEAIRKIFKESNYQPKVIIHRGHSFHTEKTLERVPVQARLVIIGSCGGFYKIGMALRNAPDAQIIATRQIGVKQINDPLILAINENLRLGKNINWKKFWDEMKDKLGSNSLFYDYVPPHKNLESLFVRAYYQLLGV